MAPSSEMTAQWGLIANAWVDLARLYHRMAAAPGFLPGLSASEQDAEQRGSLLPSVEAADPDAEAVYTDNVVAFDTAPQAKRP